MFPNNLEVGSEILASYDSDCFHFCRIGFLHRRAPVFHGDEGEGDDEKLGKVEKDEPFEGGVHEAVAVQADPEHVNPKPTEGGDDVSDDSQNHEAAFADHATPTGMENNGVPDNDEQSAVFLGVPTPETAPALIGPDAAQDSANEAEEGGKTNDAIDHGADGFHHGLAESGGENAFEDKHDGKGTGQKGGGVAKGDDDDVGGEPDVRIEDGAHHFHSVAVDGKMVGNEEGNEADDSGNDGGDSVAVDFLEQEAEKNAAPAYEDGAGVEIGDGRAALQPHANEEAEGVDGEGETKEPKSAAADFHRPDEPGNEGQDEDEDVENHRQVKRLETVVKGFGTNFMGGSVVILRDEGGLFGKRGVEFRGVLGTISGDHVGVMLNAGVDDSPLNDDGKGGSDVLPIVGTDVARCARDGGNVGSLGEALVALGKVEEFGEGNALAIVERFSGFLCVHGSQARGKDVFEVGEFPSEVGAVFHLQGVFQPEVEEETFAELEDFTLKWRALRSFEMTSQRGLFLNFAEVGFKVGEGESLGDTLACEVAPAKKIADVGIGDGKNGELISASRAHHGFH